MDSSDKALLIIALSVIIGFFIVMGVAAIEGYYSEIDKRQAILQAESCEQILAISKE